MSYGWMIEKQRHLKDEVKRICWNRARPPMRRKISMVTAGATSCWRNCAAARDSAGQDQEEAKEVLDQRARAWPFAEGKVRGGQTGEAQDKDQYNFTDPESRIMPGTRMGLSRL